MEGVLQEFAKEIVVAIVAGVISTFVLKRVTDNAWLRTILAGLVALTLAGATYYFVTLPGQQGLQRCEALWATVRPENTIAAYRGFLDGCPNSEYAGLARAQISGLCETALEEAAGEQSIEALDSLRRECSDPPFAGETQRLACQARWRRASQEHNRESYARFERDCPQSEYPVAEQVCELEWAEAVASDTVAAYGEFERTCSDSPRLAELTEKRCTAHWREATAADEISSYRSFFNACRGSTDAMHASARISAICEHQWSRARQTRALIDYQGFAQSCSDSQYYAEAIERIEDQCDGLWNRTQRRNRVGSYQEFIRTCPGTRHVDAAQFQLVRATSDKITRNYALRYSGCQIHVRPDLSPSQQQDAIEDASRECRRQAERERRGPGPGIADTILAVIIGVCAAGGC